MLNKWYLLWNMKYLCLLNSCIQKVLYIMKNRNHVCSINMRQFRENMSHIDLYRKFFEFFPLSKLERNMQQSTWLTGKENRLQASFSYLFFEDKVTSSIFVHQVTLVGKIVLQFYQNFTNCSVYTDCFLSFNQFSKQIEKFLLFDEPLCQHNNPNQTK